MLQRACLVVLVLCAHARGSQNFELRETVRASLDRVLGYIYENRMDMNVDGLFGVVFAQANLLPINGKQNLDQEKSLTSKILRESNFSKVSLSANHKIFVNHLLNSSIWVKNLTFVDGGLEYADETVTVQLDASSCRAFTKYVKGSYFSEEISDQCLVEVIEGSLRVPRMCKVSALCGSYMVDNSCHAPGYGITHRLLFLQVAKARRCLWNKKWLGTKVKEYCSYIFREAKINFDCGFHPDLDDLFLEQVLLCGFEGFKEFFSWSWMQHVLDIQSKHGCFGRYAERRKLQRPKRESNVMSFGCVDHTTGLGAAVLSLFLRFLAAH